MDQLLFPETSNIKIGSKEVTVKIKYYDHQDWMRRLLGRIAESGYIRIARGDVITLHLYRLNPIIQYLRKKKDITLSAREKQTVGGSLYLFNLVVTIREGFSQEEPVSVV